MMDAPTTQLVLGLVSTAVFFIFLVWIFKRVFNLKLEQPKIFALLPADLQKAILDAAKFGSEFVEKMDKNGDLTAYLDGLKSKSEVKLNLAVDYAVQYINGVLKTNGIDITVDPAIIKLIIQKYVYDNPDIFPSSKEPSNVGDSA